MLCQEKTVDEKKAGEREKKKPTEKQKYNNKNECIYIYGSLVPLMLST